MQPPAPTDPPKASAPDHRAPIRLVTGVMHEPAERYARCGMTRLGVKRHADEIQVRVVGHDIGLMVAYAYWHFRFYGKTPGK
jgi:hypothetical protein